MLRKLYEKVLDTPSIWFFYYLWPIEHMVLPDGNSEIGAHVRSNLWCLRCSRHLINSIAVTNRIFFFFKKDLFSFMRAQQVLSWPSNITIKPALVTPFFSPCDYNSDLTFVFMKYRDIYFTFSKFHYVSKGQNEKLSVYFV